MVEVSAARGEHIWLPAGSEMLSSGTVKIREGGFLGHVQPRDVLGNMENLPVPLKPVRGWHTIPWPRVSWYLSARAAQCSESTETPAQICPGPLNAAPLAGSLASNKIIQTGQVATSETVRGFFLLRATERKISSLRSELAIIIKCTHGWAFWPWYK